MHVYVVREMHNYLFWNAPASIVFNKILKAYLSSDFKVIVFADASSEVPSEMDSLSVGIAYGCQFFIAALSFAIPVVVLLDFNLKTST